MTKKAKKRQPYLEHAVLLAEKLYYYYDETCTYVNCVVVTQTVIRMQIYKQHLHLLSQFSALLISYEVVTFKYYSNLRLKNPIHSFYGRKKGNHDLREFLCDKRCQNVLPLSHEKIVQNIFTQFGNYQT